MKDKLIETLYSEWTEELKYSIYENKSLYIALFAADGQLIIANKPMAALFIGDAFLSLINPSFKKLLELDYQHSLIYSGYLTVGSPMEDNFSVQANVYRKADRILIVAGVDVTQLVRQNEEMRQLNREIGNLQRQLIKEKSILEKTLVQLNDSNKDLKEANETKDKFISILSHDLKNPFSVMLGFSDLLYENFDDFNKEQVTEQIQLIHKSAHKTYNMLEDLLLWSRSQLGRIQFQPQNFLLANLCNEVIGFFSEQSTKKNITLCVAIAPELEVFADKNMLKTILRNLVSNAIKFSWHNTSVTISALMSPEMLTVSVFDQGVGISSENQKKIWVLSEKLSTSGTDKEEGSGLGLLLCKEFTEKHGGSISVISEQGKGCEFRFTIPI